MIDSIDTTKRITLKELAEAMNLVIIAVNEGTISRDRGPKSDRAMNDDDARRVLMGDLKKASHKAAAEVLNLSYGQVYSARKCFTFKGVNKEALDALNAESK